MVAEPWPSPRIVYDRRFNIGLLGLERLHPFDSRKYGRAWNQLRQQFGRDLDKIRLKPARPISGSELRAVHSVAYLRRLRSARFVAAIVEVPQLRFLPGWISDWAILRPMRWATMGTVVSCRAAMEHGLVINLAGGYHHANPEDGHGFSVYADVGIAVGMLRKEGKLAESDRIVYVDLDAHQGNGVCRTFFDDRSFFIYDQYNASIFPGDLYARRRIDCDVPLPIGCDDATYLGHLRAKLPPFLDSLSRPNPVRLAIYNAGTDIYAGDRLGMMQVSEPAVLERDQFVLQELVARRIPTAVLLSGGYSRESYRMIANMTAHALRSWAGLKILPGNTLIARGLTSC